MIKFEMDRRGDNADGYPERIRMEFHEGITLDNLHREFLNFCKAMGYFVDPYAEGVIEDYDNPDKKLIAVLEKKIRKLERKVARRSKKGKIDIGDGWTFEKIPLANQRDITMDSFSEDEVCNDCDCCGECEDE